MLGLLQKLLKGGSLILVGLILGVGITSLNHSTPVTTQQVSPSPLPTHTPAVQGIEIQAATASPSATPKPTKNPTIAPTPKPIPTRAY